jgi:hypothetical protein
MSCRVTTALLLALLACSSRPQHSPDYARAAALWTELVRARPGDAAEDPRATQVLQLLAAVPADSLDSVAAADLRRRIEADVDAAAAERARRAALLSSAEAMRSPPQVALAPAIATPPPSPEVPVDPVAVGMKAEDFRAKHGGCFERRGEADVTAEDGGTHRGEVWLMKDDPECRERHAPLVGKAVLTANGAVAGVAPVGDAVRPPARRDVSVPSELRRTVELAELPDGGLGMVVDGRVVPLPPGARVVSAADGGAIR